MGSSRFLRRIAVWSTTLKRLGDVRDGLLVLGALIYAAGYGAWSYHAWNMQLGPLPALDAQYFLAGIPALGTLLLAWCAARAVVRFYVVTYPAWRVRQSRRVTRGLDWVAFLTSMAGVAYIAKYRLVAIFTQDISASDIAILAVCALSITLQREPFPDDEPALTKPEVWLTYMLTLAFALLGALAYLRIAYPRIPQVFGGAEPRAARLDLLSARITPETARLLGASSNGIITDRAYRSGRLWVYYSDRDILLVSPVLARPKRSLALSVEPTATNINFVQISREDVVSIHWLNVR